MEQQTSETLLSFFKVLGNESRLKIIGTLAIRDCTVSDLAKTLDLKEPMILQHLKTLNEIGLVKVDAEGSHYGFNVKTLHALNKEVFSRENAATSAESAEEGSDAWERKVLKAYFDGERLLELPVKGKKLQVVLQRLAVPFEYGVRYTEKQVNVIMTRFHPDYATLRRELIDHGYLERANSIYWKPESEPSKS